MFPLFSNLFETLGQSLNKKSAMFQSRQSQPLSSLVRWFGALITYPSNICLLAPETQLNSTPSQHGQYRQMSPCQANDEAAILFPRHEPLSRSSNLINQTTFIHTPTSSSLKCSFFPAHKTSLNINSLTLCNHFFHCRSHMPG